MMMYLGLSIVVNIILIVYLLYLYLYKGELRENKNVEYLEDVPPTADCAKCLSEHEILLKDVAKLKDDILKLTFANNECQRGATTIRYGMDRLMQAATARNIIITP
jgi:hypothetical protein